MGKIRNRFYWEWLQIRGNAKWQLLWSFIEPYWKAWVVVIMSTITAVAAHLWHWVIGLSFLVLFVLSFAFYVLCWGLIAFVVMTFRKQEKVGSNSRVVQRVPPPAVRDEIRWGLKPHFTRGFELRHFYKSSQSRDEEAWQEWVQEVTTFLRNHLSESHVDRWNSRDGIDPPSSLSVDVPGRNRKIYADVSFRLERLAEFNRELKDQA